MKRISSKIKGDYFRRSYEAIDGLWFMKIEHEHGFEHALDLDRRVWEIVPKIQARQLKNLLDIKSEGLAGLGEALTAKFAIEGFSCSMNTNNNGTLTFEIRKCPWFNLMEKSGRSHLAARVGEVICPAEYSIWAKEFGKDITAEIPGSICGGRKTCTIQFSMMGNSL